MIKHLFFLFALSASLCAQALDLRPYYLRISISASKRAFTTSEAVQINLTLTNSSGGNHSILVPGNQSQGKKLIYFTWYRVDENNFYREVHRDQREIRIDTSVHGYVHFNRLASGESTTVPFFFNDTKNAQTHVLSSYEVPQLAPGKYKIVAWYDPWSEELAKYAFNKIDDFKGDPETGTNPEYLDLPSLGIMSPYFDVEILATATANESDIPAACSANCRLCKAIEREKWKRVKRLVRRNSGIVTEQNMGNDVPGMLTFPHRNVAYLGDNPDAILASLPSFLSREIIFRNSNGIHYYCLTWQLGKTSRIGGRINTFFYMIGLRNLHIRDSKVNYSKLIRLTAV
jgi:hypothetical protein